MRPEDRNQPGKPGQPRPDRKPSRPSHGPSRPDHAFTRPERGPAGSDRGPSRPAGGNRPFRPDRIEPARTPAFAEQAQLADNPDQDGTQQDELLPADRLEGRNPILEAIKAGRPINKLYVLKLKERPDPIMARIVREARDSGAVIMEVERSVLDQMSVTTGHQGVIAQVAMHEYVELDDILAVAAAVGEDPFLIILDELKESYNLGSVLRIADAAGAHGVLIPKRRSVGLDAAVAKASAGAIEHVPVARVNNLSQTIETLKEKGFWIAAADEEGKTDYHDIDWCGPMALIIGSEGEGIGQQLRKHCDFLIAIPQRGKVNSLNAAVATGIIVFEAMHQRHLPKK